MTYLEHAHAICVSKYLVSFRVVAVSDVGCSDEELKGIVLAHINATTLQLLLQLTHSLLAMAARLSHQRTMPLHYQFLFYSPAKSQLLLVAPEDSWASLHTCLAQHVMKEYNLQTHNNTCTPAWMDGAYGCLIQHSKCAVGLQNNHKIISHRLASLTAKYD